MSDARAISSASASRIFDLYRARNYETTRVQSPIHRRASINWRWRMHECGFLFLCILRRLDMNIAFITPPIGSMANPTPTASQQLLPQCHGYTQIEK